MDEAGNKSQVVNWFNADTGGYKQIIYPMAEGGAEPAAVGGKKRRDPGKKPAKAAAKAKKAAKKRPRVSISPKNKFILSSVGALILVFLIGTATGFSGKQNELNAVAKAEAKAQEAFEEQKAPVVAKIEQKKVVSVESGKAEEPGPETEPAPAPVPVPEPDPEEILTEETDSVEEASEFMAAPGYEDVSETERMNINTVFASLKGKTFYNSELSGGFTIEEADNGGIYVLSMFYRNFDEGGSSRAEFFRTEPMGSKVLYEGSAFETTVYCDGYHITFTYHPALDGMAVES